MFAECVPDFFKYAHYEVQLWLSEDFTVPGVCNASYDRLAKGAWSWLQPVVHSCGALAWWKKRLGIGVILFARIKSRRLDLSVVGFRAVLLTTDPASLHHPCLSFHF